MHKRVCKGMGVLCGDVGDCKEASEMGEGVSVCVSVRATYTLVPTLTLIHAHTHLHTHSPSASVNSSRHQSCNVRFISPLIPPPHLTPHLTTSSHPSRLISPLTPPHPTPHLTTPPPHSLIYSQSSSTEDSQYKMKYT